MYSVLHFIILQNRQLEPGTSVSVVLGKKKESLFLRRRLDLVASYNWRSTHNNIFIFYYSV